MEIVTIVQIAQIVTPLLIVPIGWIVKSMVEMKVDIGKLKQATGVI